MNVPLFSNLPELKERFQLWGFPITDVRFTPQQLGFPDGISSLVNELRVISDIRDNSGHFQVLFVPIEKERKSNFRRIIECYTNYYPHVHSSIPIT